MADISHARQVSGGAASSQFLVAEIPSAETSLSSDRWKPVTLYDVRITVAGRREVWNVFRRYSKFYDLIVQLKKRFPNQSLPPIPPKRLIGKEDPQFIQQRRHELEEFLNALLKEPVEISLSEEVCLFIEVPEQLRVAFLETEAQPPTLLPIPGEAPSTLNNGGAPDESRVTWLLSQLQDLPNNKVVSIRTFEDWILKTNPPLTEASAQLLYLGLELQGGLMEEVGAFDHSEVSSIAALGLLRKLLSHEYCSEAPLFRAVLRRLDLSVLSRMRLQHHIHRNRGQSNRLDAFHVLRSLELAADRLPALLQDDFALREFRRWQEGLQSWLSFRTLHRPSLTRRRTANSEPSGLLARPALSSREYRNIAESAFTSVQMCLDTFVLPDTDVAANPFGGNSAASANLLGASAAGGSTPAVASGESSGPARSLAPETPRGGQTPSADARTVKHIWRHVPCPDPSWKSKYGLRAAYQQVPFEQQSDSYVLRAAMQLPFPAFLVACLLADHSQFIREALVLKQNQLSHSIVERLKVIAEGPMVSQLQSASTVEPLQLGTPHEAYSELVECNLGTPSAPHVAVRLCLLKSLRIIPAAGVNGGDGVGGAVGSTLDPDATPPSYLFLCTAVPPVSACVHSGCADHGVCKVGSEAGLPLGSLSSPTSSPTGGFGRSAPPRLISLKPSGVLLRPCSSSETDVSLCALLGKDSVKLVSGDLLGERLLLWRTLENLLFVLENLCPLPANFNHPLVAHQERCLSPSNAEAHSPASSGNSTPLSHRSVASGIEVELIEETVRS